MNKVKDMIWVVFLLVISFLLLSPMTGGYYVSAYDSHPFLMGFVKYAILASMGELLASRISHGSWIKVKGFYAKMVVWGIIGVIITFMFKLFPMGISAMIDHGLIYGGQGLTGKILFAIYNSLVANLAFGPLFMAAHRVSDTYIDLRAEGEKASIMTAVSKVNWPGFIEVVVGKMILFFWLPAHTITFLLPETYRILFAAYLSIVLGVLMAIAKIRTGNKGTA